MSQAVEAYQGITATEEYRSLERLRARTKHDEAQALHNARLKERKKWEGVVAGRDTMIADRDTIIAGNVLALTEKDAALTVKDATLAEQAALIAELQAKLKKRK